MPTCKKCHTREKKYDSQCYDNEQLYDYLKQTGQCRGQSKNVCLNKHFYGPYLRPCRTTDPCMPGKLAQAYHGINELCNYGYDSESDSDSDSDSGSGNQPNRECVRQCIKQCNNNTSDNFFRYNLVSNIQGVAQNTDPSLVDAWDGVVAGEHLVITANNSGLLITYNNQGKKIQQKIVPSGSPTGIVFNTTNNFVISDGLGSAPASIIITTQTGRIFAWNQFINSGELVEVVNNSSNGQYTDLTIFNNKLFVVDRQNRQIDIFSSTFAQEPSVTFTVAQLPVDYFPNSITAFNNQLFVTASTNLLVPTNGRILVLLPTGVFDRQFSADASLSSPHGIIPMPSLLYNTFNDNTYGNMLVANSGNGFIGIYNQSGLYRGNLKDNSGVDIFVPGIKSLFASSIVYFVAGNSANYGGLVGSLSNRQNSNSSGYDNEFTQINSFKECCPKKKKECFTIYKSIRKC